MEEEPRYLVETTLEADLYYYDLLIYLYQHHEPESADRKADEVLSLAESLNKNPYRGAKEPQLAFFDKDHRFLLYYYTPRKAIKIIYFVEEARKKVYVTDFFPTERHEDDISQRSS